MSERARSEQRRSERSTDRSTGRSTQPSPVPGPRRRVASPAAGTHDAGRVAVGASQPRTLWRRTPDAAEREARSLGPRLATHAGPQGHARPQTGATGGIPTPAPALRARQVSRPDGALGSGRPLAAAERRQFEPSLGVDLSGVRVHDGLAAKRATAARHAHAFTVGNHIVLGPAAQDGGPGPRAAVIAHELVHVRQQAVPTRGPDTPRARGPPPPSGFAPSSRVAGARVQCWDAGDLVPGFVSDAAGAVADAGSAAVEGAIEAGEAAFDWVLDGVRDAARSLPGYEFLSEVIGQDPITGERVAPERSDLIESLLTYGPFGPAVAAVLQAADVLGDVFAVLTEGLAEHGLTLRRVLSDIASAFDEFTLSNGIDANLAIVRRYVSAFLADVLSFVQQVAERVIEIVRSVVAALAEPLLQSQPIGAIWQLVTQVLHYDPLRGVEVQTPTVEILANFLRLIGEEDALAQMQERGTLQATADWLDTQFATFSGLLVQLGTLFTNAWAAIQPANLPNLLDNLASLAQDVFALVRGVAAFAATVIATVLDLVKDSLLAWLADHANHVPGFHMITVIIGRNPFTGEAVPRTAENLIRGFISLLPGGEAMYASLAESGVIAAAAERIEGAMTTLGITAELVVQTFLGVWNLVTLENLLDPLGTFRQIVDLFGDPIRRIFTFVTVVIEVVITLVLRLMNFPVELIGSIIANTVAAITDIQRDPVGFLLNMVAAIKAGFIGFFSNIATHLVQGLADWLFRGLGELGITIPTQWSLQAALDLVLQVLGLSMEFLWRKLGEHIGEERVAVIRENLDRLSGAWAFIRDVQQRGMSAIWDFVSDQLSNLWQTVLSMAMEWIMTRVIASATTKLLSMLDPTGIMAVITSCIAFFNAVQSAIEYLRDMLEIVGMYVSTLAAVAAGNVEPGARMIEQGLAAVIPIAIGFLANQVGLGNMPQRIVEIIQRLREMVESAVDWLITQAMRLGQAALNALGMGGGAADAADGAATPVVEAPAAELVIDEVVRDEQGPAHHLRADGPGHSLVLHSDPVPLTQMPDPDGSLAPLIAAYNQARTAYDGALSERDSALASGNDASDAGRRMREHRASINEAVGGLVAAIRGTDVATDPGASAPNIGLVERHGEQPTRIRAPSNSRIRSDELIWQTESEHILPFATGRSMWRGLRLVPTLRGQVEDEQQTTIVIYYRAARIKTPVDNRVSLMAEEAGRTAGSNFMRRLEVIRDISESGGSAATSLVYEFIEGIESGLIPLRDEAVDRTNEAIDEENKETESDHARSNSVRRGNEPPVPGPSAVRAAAQTQYQDLVRLLRNAVEEELGI